MIYGILAGFGVILASIFGSLLALLFKKISHKTNDMMLGFAAGVMFAAAFLGLLPEAFGGGSLNEIVITVVGVIVGAIFMSLVESLIPHAHFDDGQIIEKANHQHLSRVMLLIFAIALHNIPEGLATGIVFGKGINDNTMTVAISMIIQKIPEGLIVMMPLLALGMTRIRALGYGVLVAMMMLPGVILGVMVGGLPILVSAFFYAFTFGAIIFVISNEIIPETHEHGFEKAATFALIVGVLIVAIIAI